MTARRARRGEPRQERSRAMVERIVAAGREVLVTRGYDGASTNRIAAVAGVSPGSLYQYFPDKDAVLTEVLDRYLDAMEARVSRAFLDSVATAGPGAGTAAAVRATLDALLDTFGEEPDLLRVIVEQLPRSPGGRRAAFAGRIDDLVTTVLLTRGAGDTDAARAAAWTVVRTVEHLTTGYVLERPGFAREVVVDELTALVAGYLDARLSGGRVASDGPS
ncbi:transcriptional regulator, TetR family [Pseudonocardia sp. Ae406_Ps2]|uniref:TetR/AcrR family transcriptional regulator n=1 Tax=unclassified Pseudonocardia TaxID=2619320 RepID=UPI000965B3D1|nr:MULTISPECIES: TetR/AcrR family transcriptional regulator [unclassified Pseudonocardia]OLL99019.1 transcriptional regulator, TetR family [Pseudonocardia sp. Ae331_Ps2]OLM03242.1 transcriptional regulator, TetR family [Pseudonocardia sp. Ae406_Ps2]OLM24800.1 transcriptional regulator, TetR family [Pseudonocardia sp. Ae706_Ps2]